MSKKKSLLLSFLAFTLTVTVAAASGFVGGNLEVNNGALTFKNTSFNIYIGEEAGLADATDLSLPVKRSQNVGIGRRALWQNVSNKNMFQGTRNTCVGGNCMYESRDADRNACFGTACLYNNRHGINNVTGGYHAGASHETNHAVIFGAFAEEQNPSAFMSVTLGSHAARYNKGKKNVLLGGHVAAAGEKIDNSVFLGTAAGAKQKRGENNIIIGYNQNLQDYEGDNQLNIGGVLRSDDTYTGHLRMRRNAGLELVNHYGEVFRLTIDEDGLLDVQEIN